MKPQKQKFVRLNARLDGIIEQLDACRMPETVALLRMAQLDLTMRMHGVSPDELDTMIAAAPAMRAESHGPTAR